MPATTTATKARHNIPLGRILGIPIGLDYSWFVVFGLLTWMLAVNYYPAEFKDWPALQYWVVGAVTAILLFASVLLHELGHSIVALWYKVPVKSITLFLFGGVAQIGAEPPSAVAELLIAIAGPLVSLALAIFFYALQPLVGGFESLFGLFKYLAFINLALVIFNLIPGYPLDGGRVFRAIVWKITGNLRRATLIAANVGRVFAFLFILLGAGQMFGGNFGGGLWTIFIGFFLDHAASSQIQQTMYQGLLKGHAVLQAMSKNCPVVEADLTLQQMVDEHILGSGKRCFLVQGDEHLEGLVTLHRLKEVPREKWSTMRVGEAMLPLDQLKRIEPETDLWTALQQMDRDGVNQLPVTRGNAVVGMLSREDVITFLGTLQELGS